jgi:fatty-acyl-CoA synthase
VVIGVPDEHYGDAVCAWVVLNPGAELDEWREDILRGQIADSKIPRHVRFVDAFPMTVTGKLQKFHDPELEVEDHVSRRG